MADDANVPQNRSDRRPSDALTLAGTATFDGQLGSAQRRGHSAASWARHKLRGARQGGRRGAYRADARRWWRQGRASLACTTAARHAAVPHLGCAPSFWTPFSLRPARAHACAIRLLPADRPNCGASGLTLGDTLLQPEPDLQVRVLRCSAAPRQLTGYGRLTTCTCCCTTWAWRLPFSWASPTAQG